MSQKFREAKRSRGVGLEGAAKHLWALRGKKRAQAGATGLAPAGGRSRFPEPADWPGGRPRRIETLAALAAVALPTATRPARGRPP